MEKKKVLCITRTLAASFIINIRQPLEIIRGRGLVSYSVYTEEEAINKLALRDINGYDTVIFFRTTSPRVLKFLYYSKLLGKAVIFGADDNYFELAQSEEEPLPRLHLNAHARYIESADAVLVYSGPMVEMASRLNNNVVRAVPGINLATLEGLNRKEGGGRIRIVYATSRSIRDIVSEVFFSAIRRLLFEYEGRIEMNFWGYTPREFQGVAGVKTKKYVRYETYLKEFYEEGFDIGLAPLIDDLFHRSKTNTKFRDYGACRTAGIYSDVEVYSEHVVDGETGLLVKNTEDGWYRALKRLVDDDALRETIKTKAEEFVREHFNMERVASDLYGLLVSTPTGVRQGRWPSFVLGNRLISCFVGMRTPRILFIPGPGDAPWTDSLQNIRAHYGYQFRQFGGPVNGKGGRSLSRAMSSSDLVVLGDMDEGELRHLTEKAHLQNKRVVALGEHRDLSDSRLVNMIEDVFYTEMLRGMRPYKFDAWFVRSRLKRAKSSLRARFSGKPVLKYIVSVHDYLKHGTTRRP